IIERFQRALRPGGWLLLGEVELSLTPTAGLEARQFDQATFFQKPAGAPVEPVPPGFAILPPLTTVLAAGSITTPVVPALPRWGPLPWVAGGGRETTSPGRIKPPAEKT